MKRISSNFNSGGLKCSGWLYLPDNSVRPPVVVMAHGFGAEKTFGLEPFAERFVQRGMAVYLFDYRNFNGSEGEPQNLVSPLRHIQDWRAAIEYVRGLAEIDSTKIALWGTSFSGGHVLVAAAGEKDVVAVVAQIPFVDGLASASILSPLNIAHALFHGLLDVLTMIIHAKPHYVPMVSLDGEFAVLNTPDAREGYLALVPKNTDWKNRCPARILFTILSYSPVNYASKIACPVLIIKAEKDSLVPGSAVERTIVKIKRCEVLRLPIGHFEAYTGEAFETVVEREAVFLQKHLAV
jgi:dipeptidyl aminopeptidase/acylaminoacyl peptidase